VEEHRTQGKIAANHHKIAKRQQREKKTENIRSLKQTARLLKNCIRKLTQNKTTTAGTEIDQGEPSATAVKECTAGETGGGKGADQQLAGEETVIKDTTSRKRTE
jgi:hypothetical protein